MICFDGLPVVELIQSPNVALLLLFFLFYFIFFTVFRAVSILFRSHSILDCGLFVSINPSDLVVRMINGSGIFLYNYISIVIENVFVSVFFLYLLQADLK